VAHRIASIKPTKGMNDNVKNKPIAIAKTTEATTRPGSAETITRSGIINMATAAMASMIIQMRSRTCDITGSQGINPSRR
jgi:hypothetical protein